MDLARRAGSVVLCVVALIAAAWPAIAQGPAAGRTIVIGFDGMDPKLAERWMADGTLPHFAKLKAQGYYQRLATSNPPQSPVAWSSFATGLNPGEHGIFDFLDRNPETYAPEYSAATAEGPKHVLKAFGFQLPLDQGTLTNNRQGTPFWLSAERDGTKASVLRVPVTYPADPIARMLSGMGVPDLLGTQGTFTYFTTDPISGETQGGRQIHIENAARIETMLEGPPDPFRQAPTALTVPLIIERAGGDDVRVELDGQSATLRPGAWSDWINVSYRFGGFMSVSGIVRLHLVEAAPGLKLYISPIQLDPHAPAGPISSPPEYAGELADRIGPYHTLGMAEETWSLNEEKISDDAWLDMEATILAEREAMFFDTLAQKDTGLVVMVFVQTDRVSHMFWRGIDERHPLHAKTNERGRGAIEWIYREADRILGKTMAEMAPEDRLIVLSDHGFESYRRSVNLNRWLAEEGFMGLKPGAPASDQLFANVNWPRTEAYALGLNGIYLNRRGREALGVVRDEEAGELKRRISERLKQLKDPATGETVVLQVYDSAEIYEGARAGKAPDLVIGYAPGYRASWQTTLGGVPEALIEDNDRNWSGDHCIEPSAVPGIMFASFKPTAPLGSIADMPQLIRGTLGAPGKVTEASMLGGSLGFFDLPAPALFWVDERLLGWLPDGLRVAFWTFLASLASMAVYRFTSRQHRIAAIKEEVLETRKQLAAFDGEMGDMWPILRRNLGLAMKQLWLTFVPAMIAGLPVLVALAFMSNAFDARLPPPGAPVEATVTAADGQTVPPVRWQGGPAEQTAEGQWQLSWPAPGETLTLQDGDGSELLSLPTARPVRVVAQPVWYNSLIGNPGGYLPEPGPVHAVELDLPQPTVFPFGPNWLRGWLVPSLVLLVIFSLFLKFYWRLH